MQLTARTDYALRLLIYLTLHRDRPASAGEVARAYGISSHHLSKVAGELARIGWIESQRGRGGGLSLLPASQGLSVGDVVRSLEQNLCVVECLGDGNTCPIAPACGLKHALRKAAEAFLEVLDQYSLSDIVGRPDELRALLAGG